MVGSDKIYAIERYYLKYLREFGVSVNVFPAQSLFSDYYKASLINKVLFRLGVSGIYDEINSRLMDAVRKLQPRLIWVFKGMELYPETINRLRGMGIKLVNYNPDNPFIFSGRGSGNENISTAISLYDLHFTYNLEVKKLLEQSYHVAVRWLPFGYDPPLDWEPIREKEEIRRVCFLGNPDRERANFVSRLAQQGIRIDVYGNSWGKFVKHQNVLCAEPVYGPEQQRLLQRYRIQLNLMRAHNLDSHNMRTFEVPGVGGIMVAPRTPEHEMFFEDEKEVFLFDNLEHCKQTVQRLLDLTFENCVSIRERARIRCEISGYDYKSRSRMAWKEMEEWTK